MVDTIYLTQSQRDKIKANLDEKQKTFIQSYLKRGRKTVFANVLAVEKAGNTDRADIEKIASMWEFHDYIDAGPNWNVVPRLYCECGRALRYQYIVLNKKTKELKKFGINHFEEHVGIPPHLVREIKNGIERIDYEQDELLTKIANGWTLSDEGISNIPDRVEIPKDIQLHFDYNVPLLKPQIYRLKALISNYYKDETRLQVQKNREEQEARQRKEMQTAAKRREQIMQSRNLNAGLELSPELQAGVIIFLEDLQRAQFLISEVCEYLISYHGASNERFSSGTFKITPYVGMFLEQLVASGSLTFIGRQNGVDRKYQVVR